MKYTQATRVFCRSKKIGCFSLWQKVLAIILSFSVFSMDGAVYAQPIASIQNPSTANSFIDEQTSTYVKKTKAILSQRQKGFLQIPDSLGLVQETFDGAKPQRVVFLQDAHGQEDAQRSLEGIMGYLVEEHAYQSVFLEGGLPGEISPNLLKFFEEEQANRKIVEQMFKEGKVGGPGRYLFENPYRIKAYGVEDKKLYFRNLLSYRRVYSRVRLSDEFLEKLELAIGTIASQVFNSKLLDFAKQWLAFQDTEKDILRHLDELRKYARKYIRMNLRDVRHQDQYPQLIRYFKLQEIEKKISTPDFKEKSEREKEILLAWLKRAPLEEATVDFFRLLVLAGDNPKRDQVPQNARRILEIFYEAARHLGFSWDHYPHLNFHFAKTIIHQELDAIALFDEIEALTERLMQKLTKTEAEKELLDIYRDYWTLHKLFHLELTRDDHDKNLQRIEDLHPRLFAQRIAQYDEFSFGNAKQFKMVEEIYTEAVYFYELALQRDHIILESILDTLRKTQDKRIMVVAGGFHTDGVLDLLRGEDISFVSVQPRMNKLVAKDTYLDQMMLKKKWDPSLSNVTSTSPARMPVSQMGRRDQEFHRSEIRRIINGVVESPSALTRAEAFDLHGLDLDLGVQPSQARSEIRDAPHGNIAGYALRQVMTLIDDVRGFNLSTNDYQNLASDRPFDDLVSVLNTKNGEQVYEDFDAIFLNAQRTHSLAKSQAEEGRAIHEVTKNATDWSRGAQRRASKHNQGALQLLGELRPYEQGVQEDYIVIETRRSGSQGIRMTIWNMSHDESIDDFRVHYELVDDLEEGTKISVNKKFSDDEKAEAKANYRNILLTKLRYFTDGNVRVNGETINRPEQYDAVLGDGRINPDVTEVDVTISDDGFTVQDRGVGMDLKGLFENFLTPFYGEEKSDGTNAPRDTAAVKLLVKPDVGMHTVVSMGIKGHEIQTSDNENKPRLNMVEELVIDFPVGTPAPASWSVVEFDGETIQSVEHVIEYVTNVGNDIENRFAIINSLAFLIRQIKGNRTAQEHLLKELRIGTQRVIKFLRSRGHNYLFVPNDVSEGWQAFNHPRFTPLDSELFDFEFAPIVNDGTLLEEAENFKVHLGDTFDVFKSPDVSVYIPNWDLNAAAGVSSAWVQTDQGPVLLLDRSVFGTHGTESLDWYQGRLQPWISDIESALEEYEKRKAAQKPVEREVVVEEPEIEEPVVRNWRQVAKWTITAFVVAAIIFAIAYFAMTVDWSSVWTTISSFFNSTPPVETPPVTPSTPTTPSGSSGLPGWEGPIADLIGDAFDVYMPAMPSILPSSGWVFWAGNIIAGGALIYTLIKVTKGEKIISKGGMGVQLVALILIVPAIRWSIILLSKVLGFISNLFAMGGTSYIVPMIVIAVFAVAGFQVLQLLALGSAGYKSPFETNPHEQSRTEAIGMKGGLFGLLFAILIGPFLLLMSLKERKGKSKYGRIKNAPPLSEGALINQYFLRLNADGDWDPAQKVSKTVREGARPVGAKEGKPDPAPTIIEIEGSVTDGQEMTLLNYAAGIINDITIKDKETGIILSSGAWDREGEIIKFNGDFEVVIEYEVSIYKPEDVKIHIPELEIPTNEAQGLVALNEALKSRNERLSLDAVKGESDDLKRLERIRRITKRYGVYSLTAQKGQDAFDRDEKASWAHSAADRINNGEKLFCTCDSSSLLTYLLAQGSDMPAVYLGMTVPTLFGNLKTSKAGHAGALIKVENPSSGNSYWQFVETTKNLSSTGIGGLINALNHTFKSVRDFFVGIFTFKFSGQSISSIIGAILMVTVGWIPNLFNNFVVPFFKGAGHYSTSIPQHIMNRIEDRVRHQQNIRYANTVFDALGVPPNARERAIIRRVLLAVHTQNNIRPNGQKIFLPFAHDAEILQRALDVRGLYRYYANLSPDHSLAFLNNFFTFVYEEHNGIVDMKFYFDNRNELFELPSFYDFATSSDIYPEDTSREKLHAIFSGRRSINDANPYYDTKERNDETVRYHFQPWSPVLLFALDGALARNAEIATSSYVAFDLAIDHSVVQELGQAISGIDKFAGKIRNPQILIQSYRLAVSKLEPTLQSLTLANEQRDDIVDHFENTQKVFAFIDEMLGQELENFEDREEREAVIRRLLTLAEQDMPMALRMIQYLSETVEPVDMDELIRAKDLARGLNKQDIAQGEEVVFTAEEGPIRLFYNFGVEKDAEIIFEYNEDERGWVYTTHGFSHPPVLVSQDVPYHISYDSVDIKAIPDGQGRLVIKNQSTLDGGVRTESKPREVEYDMGQLRTGSLPINNQVAFVPSDGPVTLDYDTGISSATLQYRWNTETNQWEGFIIEDGAESSIGFANDVIRLRRSVGEGHFNLKISRQDDGSLVVKHFGDADGNVSFQFHPTIGSTFPEVIGRDNRSTKLHPREGPVLVTVDVGDQQTQMLLVWDRSRRLWRKVPFNEPQDARDIDVFDILSSEYEQGGAAGSDPIFSLNANTNPGSTELSVHVRRDEAKTANLGITVTIQKNWQFRSEPISEQPAEPSTPISRGDVFPRDSEFVFAPEQGPIELVAGYAVQQGENWVRFQYDQGRSAWSFQTANGELNRVAPAHMRPIMIGQNGEKVEVELRDDGNLIVKYDSNNQSESELRYLTGVTGGAQLGDQAIRNQRPQPLNHSGDVIEFHHEEHGNVLISVKMDDGRELHYALLPISTAEWHLVPVVNGELRSRGTIELNATSEPSSLVAAVERGQSLILGIHRTEDNRIRLSVANKNGVAEINYRTNWRQSDESFADDFRDLEWASEERRPEPYSLSPGNQERVFSPEDGPIFLGASFQGAHAAFVLAWDDQNERWRYSAPGRPMAEWNYLGETDFQAIISRGVSGDQLKVSIQSHGRKLTVTSQLDSEDQQAEVTYQRQYPLSAAETRQQVVQIESGELAGFLPSQGPVLLRFIYEEGRRRHYVLEYSASDNSWMVSDIVDGNAVPQYSLSQNVSETTVGRTHHESEAVLRWIEGDVNVTFNRVLPGDRLEYIANWQVNEEDTYAWTPMYELSETGHLDFRPTDVVQIAVNGLDFEFRYVWGAHGSAGHWQMTNSEGQVTVVEATGLPAIVPGLHAVTDGENLRIEYSTHQEDYNITYRWRNVREPEAPAAEPPLVQSWQPSIVVDAGSIHMFEQDDVVELTVNGEVSYLEYVGETEGVSNRWILRIPGGGRTAISNSSLPVLIPGLLARQNGTRLELTYAEQTDSSESVSFRIGGDLQLALDAESLRDGSARDVGINEMRVGDAFEFDRNETVELWIGEDLFRLEFDDGLINDWVLIGQDVSAAGMYVATDVLFSSGPGLWAGRNGDKLVLEFRESAGDRPVTYRVSTRVSSTEQAPSDDAASAARSGLHDLNVGGSFFVYQETADVYIQVRTPDGNVYYYLIDHPQGSEDWRITRINPDMDWEAFFDSGFSYTGSLISAPGSTLPIVASEESPFLLHVENTNGRLSISLVTADDDVEVNYLEDAYFNDTDFYERMTNPQWVSGWVDPTAASRPALQRGYVATGWVPHQSSMLFEREDGPVRFEVMWTAEGEATVFNVMPRQGHWEVIGTSPNGDVIHSATISGELSSTVNFADFGGPQGSFISFVPSENGFSARIDSGEGEVLGRYLYGHESEDDAENWSSLQPGSDVTFSPEDGRVEILVDGDIFLAVYHGNERGGTWTIQTPAGEVLTPAGMQLTRLGHAVAEINRAGNFHVNNPAPLQGADGSQVSYRVARPEVVPSDSAGGVITRSITSTSTSFGNEVRSVVFEVTWPGQDQPYEIEVVYDDERGPLISDFYNGERSVATVLGRENYNLQDFGGPEGTNIRISVQRGGFVFVVGGLQNISVTASVVRRAEETTPQQSDENWEQLHPGQQVELLSSEFTSNERVVVVVDFARYTIEYRDTGGGHQWVVINPEGETRIVSSGIAVELGAAVVHYNPSGSVSLTNPVPSRGYPEADVSFRKFEAEAPADQDVTIAQYEGVPDGAEWQELPRNIPNLFDPDRGAVVLHASFSDMDAQDYRLIPQHNGGWQVYIKLNDSDDWQLLRTLSESSSHPFLLLSGSQGESLELVFVQGRLEVSFSDNGNADSQVDYIHYKEAARAAAGIKTLRTDARPETLLSNEGPFLFEVKWKGAEKRLQFEAERGVNDNWMIFPIKFGLRQKGHLVESSGWKMMLEEFGGPSGAFITWTPARSRLKVLAASTEQTIEVTYQSNFENPTKTPLLLVHGQEYQIERGNGIAVTIPSGYVLVTDNFRVGFKENEGYIIGSDGARMPISVGDRQSDSVFKVYMGEERTSYASAIVLVFPEEARMDGDVVNFRLVPEGRPVGDQQIPDYATAMVEDEAVEFDKDSGPYTFETSVGQPGDDGNFEYTLKYHPGTGTDTGTWEMAQAGSQSVQNIRESNHAGTIGPFRLELHANGNLQVRLRSSFGSVRSAVYYESSKKEERAILGAQLEVGDNVFDGDRDLKLDDTNRLIVSFQGHNGIWAYSVYYASISNEFYIKDLGSTEDARVIDASNPFTAGPITFIVDSSNQLVIKKDAARTDTPVYYVSSYESIDNNWRGSAPDEYVADKPILLMTNYEGVENSFFRIEPMGNGDWIFRAGGHHESLVLSRGGGQLDFSQGSNGEVLRAFVNEEGKLVVTFASTSNASRVVVIQGVPPVLTGPSGQTKRFELLPVYNVEDPEVESRFDGREKLYVDWLVNGGRLDFEDHEPLQATVTDDVVPFLLGQNVYSADDGGLSLGRLPEIREETGTRQSLAWIIDAAKWTKRALGGTVRKLTFADVRDGLKASVDSAKQRASVGGSRTPQSERPMLKTISKQDRTRMVWIREAIQNSIDAILDDLPRLLARGLHVGIEARSYLTKIAEQTFWVFSIRDYVGMDLNTLFLKFFPPGATEKSVEENLREILARENNVGQKFKDILDLIDPEYHEEVTKDSWLMDLLTSGKTPEQMSREVVDQYSDFFKSSLGSGFFGVGNYTVYALADEVNIRTARFDEDEGKVIGYDVRVRVLREDPSDERRVTGLLLLHLRSTEQDPDNLAEGEELFEGTLIQMFRKVEGEGGLIQAEIDDKNLQYLFPEYVGAVDPAVVPISLVRKNSEGNWVPDLSVKIHDNITVLSSYGTVNKVDVVKSKMGIIRTTVNRLFIDGGRESDHQKLLYSFVPKWIQQWMDDNAIGVDFERSTPVIESREHLEKTVKHRHDVAVASMKAVLTAYRNGEIDLREVGLPPYQEFLASPHLFSDLLQDSQIIEDARRINANEAFYRRGESAEHKSEEDKWGDYLNDPKRYGALLLMIDAQVGDNPNDQRSLLSEKEELLFNAVPSWVKERFYADSDLRQAVAESEAQLPSTDNVENYSRNVAYHTYRAIVKLYAQPNGTRLEGFPLSFEEYLDTSVDFVTDEAVIADIATLREDVFGNPSSLNFDRYRAEPDALIAFLLALPIRGRQAPSVNDEKERIKREAEEAERRRQEELERQRRAAELAAQQGSHHEPPVDSVTTDVAPDAAAEVTDIESVPASAVTHRELQDAVSRLTNNVPVLAENYAVLEAFVQLIDIVTETFAGDLVTENTVTLQFIPEQLDDLTGNFQALEALQEFARATGGEGLFAHVFDLLTAPEQKGVLAPFFEAALQQDAETVEKIRASLAEINNMGESLEEFKRFVSEQNEGSIVQVQHTIQRAGTGEAVNEDVEDTGSEQRSEIRISAVENAEPVLVARLVVAQKAVQRIIGLEEGGSDRQELFDRLWPDRGVARILSTPAGAGLKQGIQTSQAPISVLLPLPNDLNNDEMLALVHGTLSGLTQVSKTHKVIFIVQGNRSEVRSFKSSFTKTFNSESFERNLIDPRGILRQVQILGAEDFASMGASILFNDDIVLAAPWASPYSHYDFSQWGRSYSRLVTDRFANGRPLGLSQVDFRMHFGSFVPAALSTRLLPADAISERDHMLIQGADQDWYFNSISSLGQLSAYIQAALEFQELVGSAA